MEKEVKGNARDDRLILRKTNEEVFRKQHNNEGTYINTLYQLNNNSNDNYY